MKLQGHEPSFLTEGTLQITPPQLISSCLRLPTLKTQKQTNKLQQWQWCEPECHLFQELMQPSKLMQMMVRIIWDLLKMRCIAIASPSSLTITRATRRRLLGPGGSVCWKTGKLYDGWFRPPFFWESQEDVFDLGGKDSMMKKYDPPKKSGL